MVWRDLVLTDAYSGHSPVLQAPRSQRKPPDIAALACADWAFGGMSEGARNARHLSRASSEAQERATLNIATLRQRDRWRISGAWFRANKRRVKADCLTPAFP